MLRGCKSLLAQLLSHKAHRATEQASNANSCTRTHAPPKRTTVKVTSQPKGPGNLDLPATRIAAPTAATPLLEADCGGCRGTHLLRDGKRSYVCWWWKWARSPLLSRRARRKSWRLYPTARRRWMLCVSSNEELIRWRTDPVGHRKGERIAGGEYKIGRGEEESVKKALWQSAVATTLKGSFRFFIRLCVFAHQLPCRLKGKKPSWRRKEPSQTDDHDGASCWTLNPYPAHSFHVSPRFGINTHSAPHSSGLYPFREEGRRSNLNRPNTHHTLRCRTRRWSESSTSSFGTSTANTRKQQTAAAAPPPTRIPQHSICSSHHASWSRPATLPMYM